MSCPSARDPVRLALWSLTALFAIRVAAQPLALLIPALPAFDAWHGSVMPYPVLLASQLTILAVMIKINIRCTRGQLDVRPKLARILTVLGVAYFSMMLGRLVLGQILEPAPAWFARPLPALFHLVLATWLIVLGHRLGRHDD